VPARRQVSRVGRRHLIDRPSHFQRRAERAIANRHVFRYLAAATGVLVMAAGVTAWLVDRRDFATLGDALWWAVQTLTTVGYGDIVPHTPWGRVVGTVVIILGVTFLSLLTATITSYFVASNQEVKEAEVEALRGDGARREGDATAGDDATRETLERILERLTAIEEALRERSGRGAEQ
jgi:hypothetical protein